MVGKATQDEFDGKSILVLGGDGFCGWPTALRMSALRADVTILDNGSRRAIDADLGTKSLTRIASLDDRVKNWQDLTGHRIGTVNLDLATGYDELVRVLTDLRPEIIVHFAEQRSAPYSMMSAQGARYSVDNNVRSTHNLLAAVVEVGLDPHLVHLGTIGVYGYSSAGIRLPEGYLKVTAEGRDGRKIEKEILFPGRPDSVYHLTKVLDQQICAFYATRWKLRITDLHQGTVWGTQTAETRRHPTLVNRYDTDAIYGTVVNRFLLQAFRGDSLSVYGSGSQMRAFIHIEDVLTCICIMAARPPTPVGRVAILNQFSETSTVNAVAARIQQMTGAKIAHLENPRVEPEWNEFAPDRSTLDGLGFAPKRLETDLKGEFDALDGLVPAGISERVN